MRQSLSSVFPNLFTLRTIFVTAYFFVDSGYRYSNHTSTNFSEIFIAHILKFLVGTLYLKLQHKFVETGFYGRQIKRI